MPFESLRDFLEALEKAGEVRRIKSEVSPDLEIAEILRRVMYAKGPAILFENVEGSEMPVLGNAFGSMRRMEIALDTKNFESLGTRLTELLSREIPTSVLAKLRSLPKLAEITGYAPKVVKAGPVMEVIETEAPSLSFLPALKTWPKDGGKFITFGLVLTKNPDSGSRNLGVYRLQIYDDKTMAMHWQIHKRGALHFKMMQEQGKRL
ncbi:MAG: UbiD family decarboxylase domain-containing protein, partial [Nitrososphaerales archaeon]